ncbi:MAG: DNA gyrase inhibitor YacG [Deltaproteobacteria bacterium]|nr:DNA gyrase inhibitor YacG [Deltaproteobacteria bacterium]
MTSAPKCPTCGGPVPPTSAAFPFCSSRCRLVDLGRWLGEEYRIPAVEDDVDPPDPSARPTPPAATPPVRN